MKMESSTSGNETCYPPDVKAGFEELCPVCGDKVSGYHYGLLTCESCKGFFKRTVQNKKVYSCVDNRSCHIDKSQRKRCPYCRFQKCLSVGMKLEAVRSDRMRGGRNKFGPMYKRDRAIKQQAVRQQQHILSQCSLHLPNGIPSLPPSPEDSHHSPQESTRHVTSSPVHSYSLSSSSTIPAITSHTSNANHTEGGGSFTVTGPLSAYPHPMRSHDPYIISHAFPSTIEALRAYPPTALSSHQPFTPVVPPLVADLKSGLSEESEVKNKLLNFMQSEFGQFNINNPDKFLHILCKLVDQLLFLMVEWARSSIFFKDMRVEDQMKLLQNSWSEILFLDFVYRQVHDCWGSEIVLENGQKINLDILDKLGLGDLKTRLLELIKKTKEVNLDIHEYACLKFIILLNPDVSGLENRQYVEESQERVNASLLEYCLSFYPDVKDKFGQILLRLPEIRLISIRAEEYMYYKHMMGDVPDQTLLMEMLHSKKK
ncbi:hypothetical protein LOTGIDRAFT_196914 [Lottia gigantea]|uniref:Uncharacterized protein n=1 Tax=Lottia gigantea TaxID=225164 RepID=V3Z0C1_LOTGI|nr:hypothetical protein LOTGIDRAFT_196914 [Lottia gigantea]ESO83898.1 hypothetical protein LOTGIDRAFT_196914 [Lottia gigantea]